MTPNNFEWNVVHFAACLKSKPIETQKMVGQGKDAQWVASGYYRLQCYTPGVDGVSSDFEVTIQPGENGFPSLDFFKGCDSNGVPQFLEIVCTVTQNLKGKAKFHQDRDRQASVEQPWSVKAIAIFSRKPDAKPCYTMSGPSAKQP